ncbi:DUF6090 family protein [Maribacter arenosus]|uniref:Uncharacterized protein n=1 Tax=Maribacter arenosus TaxID=1854708 RepID=A0ABR7VI24_9FLAO|nr:DUF6090 family protein [Maribacter arenosus]MBD0851792.1 hypothetical protein [Maribacter arenosus]
MIKFFRRIRQQLLTENKPALPAGRFSKYLIYAIGEIILVVIGILIALAINNSNQNRVTKEKEQIYLAGLKNEFETSRLKLIQLIEVNRQNYEGAKEIMGHMFMDTVSITEVQFSKLLFGSFASDIAFNPNNSLLNEMINSGSLKDISNTELRKQLTNWISTLEDIARQENELGVHREKVVDIIRINENSIRTIMDLSGVSQELGLPMANVKMSNLKLLESTEFENNMLIFILTSYSTEKNHYNPLMHHLNYILQLIEAEIK